MSNIKTVYEIMQAYSFGLLQLLCEFLHSLGVFLSHLLDLGLVGSVLVLDGSLQQGDLLFTFGSAEQMDGLCRCLLNKQPFTPVSHDKEIILLHG